MKDICNELDVRSLCHKILQNVSILLNADRGSLFLVQGDRGSYDDSRGPSNNLKSGNSKPPSCDTATINNTSAPNERSRANSLSSSCSGNSTRPRFLVSKLFDVCSRSTLQEMEKKEEIRIPWVTGIVGYVGESGEPVNIPDAYKVSVEVVTHSASRLCVCRRDKC